MKSTDVTEHPDDVFLLDTLNWSQSTTQPYCDFCGQAAATVVVGWVDSGSGPGYDIRNCRPCLAQYLRRVRAEAEQLGMRYMPALPYYH